MGQSQKYTLEFNGTFGNSGTRQAIEQARLCHPLHGHHLVLHRTSNNPNNPDQQKVGVSPRARVVPRPLTELDPETAKLIEDVTIDSKGRAIPKLYSKLQANAELRKMLNIAM